LATKKRKKGTLRYSKTKYNKIEQYTKYKDIKNTRRIQETIQENNQMKRTRRIQEE